MPRYDFQCRVCDAIICDVFIPLGELAFRATLHCKTQMTRLPTAPNFTIKGFSAKNGYSK